MEMSKMNSNPLCPPHEYCFRTQQGQSKQQRAADTGDWYEWCSGVGGGLK